jgi:hypothetical protein
LPDNKQRADSYLKYTGLAFQMVGTIGLAMWGGYSLDQWLELQFPVFLLSFTLLSLTGSIFMLIRQLPGD